MAGGNHLYLIGGSMGVGKTAAAQLLKRRLPRVVLPALKLDTTDLTPEETAERIAALAGG